ncbi:MAG: hypothetical protein EOO88_60615 [Pedobacter sp.]|nr:MAG: hypothetical protein EOO88_60615 [Pedobacter sp.]
MSKLNINVPHQLSQPEALDRIKSLLTNLKKEQGDRVSNMKEEWTDNSGRFSFTMQGFDLSGSFEVTEGNLSINADLPFALSFFKGQIQSVIENKARELLKREG